MLATAFIILGPILSNPVALLESKAINEADTCSKVILGLLKYITFGTLSFTKFQLSFYRVPAVAIVNAKNI